MNSLTEISGLLYETVEEMEEAIYKVRRWKKVPYVEGDPLDKLQALCKVLNGRVGAINVESEAWETDRSKWKTAVANKLRVDIEYAVSVESEALRVREEVVSARESKIYVREDWVNRIEQGEVNKVFAMVVAIAVLLVILISVIKNNCLGG